MHKINHAGSIRLITLEFDADEKLFYSPVIVVAISALFSESNEYPEPGSGYVAERLHRFCLLWKANWLGK
jgi:hypothetical protein